MGRCRFRRLRPAYSWRTFIPTKLLTSSMDSTMISYTKLSISSLHCMYSRSHMTNGKHLEWMRR
ncbi:hypothetical protein GCK32_021409 [Trichostrongylus colubriformis]|uniref:Uncharacterized protein n=1 Tax=Trichostrongylus colubriformis TaxID=6319 RepID=A0AAN8F8Y1_TRICO